MSDDPLTATDSARARVIRRPPARVAKRGLLLALACALAVSARGIEAQSAERGGFRSAARQAEEALERGSAILFTERGTERFEEAEGAFSEAIERLQPLAGRLDEQGRGLLARALDYRAQTRLLRGMVEESEADLEALIEADPSYLPDPANTSRKILERFEALRVSRVGFVTVAAEPGEVEVLWNGRLLGEAARLQPVTPVLAGAFTLRGRLACAEDEVIEGALEAGETRAFSIRIDPIARPVRFETEPEGFEVELNGVVVGRTASGGESTGSGGSQDGSPESAGTLLIDCVPAGDHAYALKRDCYAEAHGTVSVIVDFVDRSPLEVPLFTSRRRESQLTIASDTPGATLLIDGVTKGRLPVKDLPACPGPRQIEVRAGESLVWSGRTVLEEGPVRLYTPRRPRLVVVQQVEDQEEDIEPGARSRIGERLASLEFFNVEDSPAISSLEPRLLPIDATPEGRPVDSMPFGGHLLLTVEPIAGASGGLRLGLIPYPMGPAESVSCEAGAAECLAELFRGLEEPWPPSQIDAGLVLATAPEPGGVLVSKAAGAAAAAGVRDGDRLVAAAGTTIETERDLASALAFALALEEAEVAQVPLVFLRDGERRETSLRAARMPRIVPPGQATVPPARLLATADFEASLLEPGPWRNAALLQLASGWMGLGEHARALSRALDRPSWSPVAGGPAAAASGRFLAGICHAASGDRERAKAAFEASASDREARLWVADGPGVAPAARLMLMALEEEESR